MAALRLLIVTLVAGGLAYWLLRVVVQGLRTGRVRHSDMDKSVGRPQNPIAYWALTAFFTAVAALAVGVWIGVVLDVIR